MTTAPRLLNRTPSWMRAWVPMARSTEPSSIPLRISRRSAPVTRFVSSSTRRGRSPNRLAGSGTVTPSSRRRTPAACCSASTSVGAINAPWWPALHGGQQRRHGDHRLAGADVALQQAVHRVRAGEIGLDLVDRAPLRRRQREGQTARGSGRRAHPRSDGGCRGTSARRPACASRARAAHAGARRTPAAAGRPPSRPSSPAGGCRRAPPAGRSGRSR